MMRYVVMSSAFLFSLGASPLTAEDGWSDLFAGGSLEQWTRHDGKPVPEAWSIENGVVHFSRAGGKAGGDLVTKAKYEDFELTFEWKISQGGNSGVKYRATERLGLEYQILDDERHPDRQKPNHRSASLYDILAAPDDKPLKPVGEWNVSRIRAIGGNLEHWLNGVKVVEIDQGSDDWKKRFAASKYRSHEGFGTGDGSILLQDHGDEVWFRKVRIRKMTP